MENEFIDIALKMAKKAYKKNEVPVGAIIVKNNKVIAKGFNMREKSQNAIMHAEIVAIIKACKKLKTYRLNDCQMYVTLEPCPMCAGAIISARIGKLYFGAYDPKAGCCGSVYNLMEGNFNHKPQVEGGILKEQCGKILTNFFKKRRK